jgi:hypothetical protein
VANYDLSGPGPGNGYDANGTGGSDDDEDLGEQRQAMIDELAQHGFDTELLSDAIPNEILAEMVRSIKAAWNQGELSVRQDQTDSQREAAAFSGRSQRFSERTDPRAAAAAASRQLDRANALLKDCSSGWLSAGQAAAARAQAGRIIDAARGGLRRFAEGPGAGGQGWSASTASYPDGKPKPAARTSPGDPDAAAVSHMLDEAQALVRDLAGGTLSEAAAAEARKRMASLLAEAQEASMKSLREAGNVKVDQPSVDSPGGRAGGTL